MNNLAGILIALPLNLIVIPAVIILGVICIGEGIYNRKTRALSVICLLILLLWSAYILSFKTKTFSILTFNFHMCLPVLFLSLLVFFKKIGCKRFFFVFYEKVPAVPSYNNYSDI